jgi:hypothetical protein
MDTNGLSHLHIAYILVYKVHLIMSTTNELNAWRTCMTHFIQEDRLSRIYI